MIKPSVSVIIPAYNAGHFLPHAIESVRAQQWPDLEIIVVDDGSTDDTPAVISNLSGNDLRMISQENAGVSAARNQGIEAAQGDWIAFLDADDNWLPGKLTAQFEVIQQNPNVGLSFTDVRFQYADGKTRDVRYETQDRPLLVELLTGNILVTPTVMARRDCLQDVGPFDVTMRTGEDWDMWLRLAERYECVHLPKVVAIYRADDTPNFLKYPLEMLEFCTLQVIDKFFSRLSSKQELRNSRTLQRTVYAWQEVVLAKSYLRGGRKKDFLRLLSRAILTQPSALAYFICRGEASTALARRQILSAFPKEVGFCLMERH